MPRRQGGGNSKMTEYKREGNTVTVTPTPAEMQELGEVMRDFFKTEVEYKVEGNTVTIVSVKWLGDKAPPITGLPLNHSA